MNKIMVIVILVVLAGFALQRFSRPGFNARYHPPRFQPAEASALPFAIEVPPSWQAHHDLSGSHAGYRDLYCFSATAECGPDVPGPYLEVWSQVLEPETSYSARMGLQRSDAVEVACPGSVSADWAGRDPHCFEGRAGAQMRYALFLDLGGHMVSVQAMVPVVDWPRYRPVAERGLVSFRLKAGTAGAFWK